MLDASQLADRFLIMPGRKTLSYQERQGPTWGTAFTVYDAERKNPTAKDLADAAAIDSVVAEKPAEVLTKLTVADIDAEIQRRGYNPLSLAEAIEAVK